MEDDAHAAAAVANPFAKPVARWVALVAATAIVLYVCWLILAPFLDVLTWAVVLVVAFQPVHRRLAAKLRPHPGLAAACSCAVVIVTILIPLSLAGLALTRDAVKLGHALEAHKDVLSDPTGSPALAKAMGWAERRFGLDPDEARAYLADKARQVGAVVAAKSLNVLGGALGVIVQVFMVIFTMFYLFRDGPRLRGAFRDVLPLERWQAHDVFRRTKDVIVASVYGSLVIAAIQGTLGGLAFWALGLPSPLLWGFVMLLLSMIPMAGSAIVWVPAAIYLVATGHWVKAILLTVWGAGVIGTVDNVLRPRLVGERTRLHELVVFFAVLGGIQVFGVLGVITGPVVAAVALALLDVWRQAKTPRTAVEPSAAPLFDQAPPSGGGDRE